MNLSEAENIFHEALEMSDRAGRAAFLDSACAHSPELRSNVEQLLVAHEQSGGVLDTIPAETKTLTETAVEEGPGSKIGRYKLLERIGEGGCGVVYVAEQTEPVRRRVALKVIKLGMDTKAVVARFEAERQALAMMDHPNIAKVLDAGTTDAGRPYFVMELVRGVRITEYCDQNRLSTTDRLGLFMKVCHAIQHAHQKGIIHRDIKPSNILVTLHDGVPVPKVIDFGIAKATEGRLTDATVYTQLHQFIGTPAYMSPEQAEMSGLDIDTRSDIYSLGVLLYELLTGATPFDANELFKQGIDAMRRTIREKEPVRPSTRLGTLDGNELTTTAKRRSVESSKLLSQLRGDLDWIVMKCLEKDRTRRYDTANSLAADLKRHLTNEPVIARPPSTAYRLQKAWRRNRLAYSAGLAVAAALVAGVIVSWLQAKRARQAESLANSRLLDVQRERDTAEESRKNTEQIAQFLQQIFQSPDPKKDGRTITVAETLDRAAKKLETDLANQPERRARLQATLAGTYGALGLPVPAVRLREQTRAFWLNKLGPDAPETMAEARALGSHLYLAGDLPQALQIAEDLLARNRRIYGREHTNSVRALLDYANAVDSMGRNREALPLRVEVLEAYRKLLGPEHEDTLGAMDALAMSYHYTGAKEKSFALQEELAVLSPKVMGPEHPMTLGLLANLAVDYNEYGRYEDSIKLLEPLVITQRRVFGPDHPQTLFTLQTLSSTYFSAGRREEALKLGEEVLELTRKHLGPEHPDIVFRMRILGKYYAGAGRTNDAFRLYEQALTTSKKIFGMVHRETGYTADMLAFAYYKAERIQDAISMGEQAVDVTRQLLGENKLTIERLRRLVAYYEAAKLQDKALQTQEEIIGMLKKLSGEETAEVVGAIKLKADFYAAWGKWAEARKELLRLVDFKTLPDEAHYALMALASLDVYLADAPGYEAHRKLMLTRFGNANTAQIANRISKACLLLPAEGEALKMSVALGDLGVKLTDESTNLLHWRFLAKALAKYRAGDWTEAAGSAEQSIKLAQSSAKPDVDSLVPAYMLMAMAKKEKNRVAEARAALKRGLELADKLPPIEKGLLDGWHDIVIAQILLREAKALIPL